MLLIRSCSPDDGSKLPNDRSRSAILAFCSGSSDLIQSRRVSSDLPVGALQFFHVLVERRLVANELRGRNSVAQQPQEFNILYIWQHAELMDRRQVVDELVIVVGNQRDDRPEILRPRPRRRRQSTAACGPRLAALATAVCSVRSASAATHASSIVVRANPSSTVFAGRALALPTPDPARAFAADSLHPWRDDSRRGGNRPAEARHRDRPPAHRPATDQVVDRQQMTWFNVGQTSCLPNSLSINSFQRRLLTISDRLRQCRH